MKTSVIAALPPVKCYQLYCSVIIESYKASCRTPECGSLGGNGLISMDVMGGDNLLNLPAVAGGLVALKDSVER